jgi:hypothetical protein
MPIYLKRLTNMTVALALLAATRPLIEAKAEEAQTSCDLSDFSNISEVTDKLTDRAVDIINMAAASDWKQNARLSSLVSPDAPVSLGAGDVNRPFGKSLEGLRRLVREMNADSYRTNTWSYIPYAVDACSEHGVKIDFLSHDSKQYSSVEFRFQAGRLISAKGWLSGYREGPISKISNP